MALNAKERQKLKGTFKVIEGGLLIKQRRADELARLKNLANNKKAFCREFCPLTNPSIRLTCGLDEDVTIPECGEAVDNWAKAMEAVEETA